MVVGNNLGAGGDGLGRAVNGSDALAQPQVDGVFGIELGRAQPETLFLHLAQQIGLESGVRW